MVQDGQLVQPGLLEILSFVNLFYFCRVLLPHVDENHQYRGVTTMGKLTSTVAVQAPAGATVVV